MPHADELAWKRAKKIVEKEYPDLSKDGDKFWSIVQHIYQNMKKASLTIGRSIISRIVRRKDKYFVYSEDGKKKLGGPYSSRKKALERLRQVEYYKHNSSFFPEHYPKDEQEFDRDHGYLEDVRRMQLDDELAWKKRYQKKSSLIIGKWRNF